MGGRLQDRITIVTGAGCIGPGWGNGRAIAVRFAEEGAKIFAVDRDLDSVTETVERVNYVPYWLKPGIRTLFRPWVNRADRKQLRNLARLAEERAAS